MQTIDKKIAEEFADGVSVAIGAENPTDKTPEWNPSKRWNPFNSYKLLAHVETWRKIKRGKSLPAPILVTVDPTNRCNLNCVWCNAEYIRSIRKRSLSARALETIADFLPRWSEGNPYGFPGVQAICVAGGGEPLLNEATGGFIDRVISNGVEVGVVTNGLLIDRYVDSLSQATWVGVSVDAGTKETFEKLKCNGATGTGSFERVIDNIAILSDYARSHYNKLGWAHPAYGVSYKYLLYKDNIGEIYEAARLAREIGCKNIHFRPAGTTWDKIGSPEEIGFSGEDVRLFQDQIVRTMELDDETFGVYGVTHKFNNQFKRANYFAKCHAVFMTAVIEPPTGPEAPEDSFVVGLCCDRRGDASLELARNVTEVGEVQRLWGSETHWRMHDRIDPERDCPRCTYQPHNEVYEQVILNDSMTHKFI
ncbi:MAG: radical SAM protein [Phycisphaerae bacterium]|nr:radical SAM protein [Phycisphaerae bacterium]